MLAIEGFFHRLGHGAFVQVREEHARPRHALQHRPVHAQREAEQQHQRTPREACQRGARDVGHGERAQGEGQTAKGHMMELVLNHFGGSAATGTATGVAGAAGAGSGILMTSPFAAAVG